MSTFPILNSQELQRILVELELIQPDTTFQQIPKTSYGSIYYALLYKLLGAKHVFPQPPQGYQEFSKMYIYMICRKYFPKFNINDLCTADILNPSAQRFQAHLSGIVNFIRLYLKYQLLIKQYLSSANQQHNENVLVNQEQNKSQETLQHNTKLVTSIKQIREQLKQPLDELCNQCNHYLKKIEVIKQIQQQQESLDQEKKKKQQLLNETYQQYQKMLDEVPAEAKQYLQDKTTQALIEQKEKELENKKIQLQQLDEFVVVQQQKLKILEECSSYKTKMDDIKKQNIEEKIKIMQTQIQKLQRLKDALIDLKQHQSNSKTQINKPNSSKISNNVQQSSQISDNKITELTVTMQHLIKQIRIQAQTIQETANKDIKNIIVYQK